MPEGRARFVTITKPQIRGRLTQRTRAPVKNPRKTEPLTPHGVQNGVTHRRGHRIHHPATHPTAHPRRSCLTKHRPTPDAPPSPQTPAKPVQTTPNATELQPRSHVKRGHQRGHHHQKGTQIHDEKVRQISGRLARLERQAPPCRLPHPSRGQSPSGHDASLPKPQPAAGTIARAAAEYQQAQKHNPNTRAALGSIVAAHGTESGHQLTAAKVHQACEKWQDFSAHTRNTYSKCLRRFLAWLEEIEQAPKAISRAVPRIHAPSYRAIIATDDERSRLIAAADPAFRFFLLLCGAHGIRHRTAPG